MVQRCIQCKRFEQFVACMRQMNKRGMHGAYWNNWKRSGITNDVLSFLLAGFWYFENLNNLRFSVHMPTCAYQLIRT